MCFCVESIKQVEFCALISFQKIEMICFGCVGMWPVLTVSTGHGAFAQHGKLYFILLQYIHFSIVENNC